LAAEVIQAPRLRELAFDSYRKRMSTIHQINVPETRVPKVVYVKGAPHEILDLCTHIIRNGQLLELGEAQHAQIMTANDEYARGGLRVLAVAMRWMPEDEDQRAGTGIYSPQMIEQNLTFLGLMAISDPPRPEVAAAVKKCHQAGIRIVMITGDYGLTAESIARKTGIIQGDHPRILTELDLKQMDSNTLQEALREEVIFARVAPELKLRVVNELQEMDHVVAVTGDGVNDSPALKKADIGVAMGIAGTDVAKEAADMILTDDNFASIVNAIEEGRAVYKNIRKFAVYVFNSNMAEAVPFILFLFSRGVIPLPLTVMQVLSIDLGTDMVPAIGLGTEPPESGIMDQPPRSPQERLLSRQLLMRALLWYGMIEAVAAIAAYFFLNWLHGWPNVPLASTGIVYQTATTMALAAIVISQIGAVFNCRTEQTSIFKIGFFTNRMVLFGIGVELTLLGILIYTPFLHSIFNTAPLGVREWAFLLIWAPVIFLADEIRKLWLRKREERGADKERGRSR
jgi:P-type Ca2+ transporter type 2C